MDAERNLEMTIRTLKFVVTLLLTATSACALDAGRPDTEPDARGDPDPSAAAVPRPSPTVAPPEGTSSPTTLHANGLGTSPSALEGP